LKECVLRKTARGGDIDRDRERQGMEREKERTKLASIGRHETKLD